MNIYQAIMKAADHIERNPDLWNYNNLQVPACGTPGCALGWIGFFLGMNGEVERVAEAMGLPAITEFAHDYPRHQHEFYARIAEIDNGTRGTWPLATSLPAEVAALLRSYANKYHADEGPKDHIPESVRAMFKRPVSV